MILICSNLLDLEITMNYSCVIFFNIFNIPYYMCWCNLVASVAYNDVNALTFLNLFVSIADCWLLFFINNGYCLSMYWVIFICTRAHDWTPGILYYIQYDNGDSRYQTSLGQLIIFIYASRRKLKVSIHQ